MVLWPLFDQSDVSQHYFNKNQDFITLSLVNYKLEQQEAASTEWNVQGSCSGLEKTDTNNFAAGRLTRASQDLRK